MKEFFKKYKSEILRVAAAIGIVAVVSVAIFLILLACGVVYYDDGMKLNASLVESFRSSALGIIGFLTLQTVLTVLLCAIPGTNMTFILLAVALFPDPVKAFLLAFSGVMLSSAAMYIAGRAGGYKLCEKLIGSKDCARAAELLRDKGSVYFPLMMLFPAFPDDALVMIAGVVKMKLGWFIPSVLVGRGVGIATIVFGLNIVPFASFSLYDWFVFISACAFWIVVIFFLAHKLNLKLEKKRSEHKKTDTYSDFNDKTDAETVNETVEKQEITDKKVSEENNGAANE